MRPFLQSPWMTLYELTKVDEACWPHAIIRVPYGGGPFPTVEGVLPVDEGISHHDGA
jgi:hypothetical protein